MTKFNIYMALVLILFSSVSFAEEKRFLTVDELIENGYILLSGEQLLDIMANRTIRVVDIETDAVTVSEKSKKNEAMERKFVETKSDKSSTLLDAQLMARAPMLDGEIERKVVGDALVSSNGIRTYSYKLYKKQKRIFAVRDIDYGNVFFEIELSE